MQMQNVLTAGPLRQPTSRFHQRRVLQAPLRVNPTLLAADGPIRREPRRPVHLREPDFDEKFDSQTLFYDQFCSVSGREVILLGPDFCNLAEPLQRLRAIALPAGLPASTRMRQLDRHGQIWISIPPGTERILLRSDIGEFEFQLRSNLSALFAGERVILTLSRNNRLEWIQDWIRYNRDVHGATAVLLYDNASTRYTTQELSDAVTDIAGIRRACVVEWPFKYGPQGGDAKSGWDSDYCQQGIMEHARHCFLADARSVLNSDIDELVVSAAGRSVFEAAEASPLGTIRYHGVWVPGLRGISPDFNDQAPARHRDFHHAIRARRSGLGTTRAAGCPTKWAAVPSRCPTHCQWTAHRIKNWMLGRLTTGTFEYRHFREITDHWKCDRSARDRFDPAKHVTDAALLASFARVNWDS
jgi:hypothetical protein